MHPSSGCLFPRCGRLQDSRSSFSAPFPQRCPGRLASRTLLLERLSVVLLDVLFDVRHGPLSNNWTAFQNPRNWNDVITVAAPNCFPCVLGRHLVFSPTSFAFDKEISHVSPLQIILSWGKCSGVYPWLLMFQARRRLLKTRFRGSSTVWPDL